VTKTTIDLGIGGIDVMLAINELPRWPEWAKTAEARQKLAEEEAVVRDDLVHYNYSYGAMDLERTMAHFADDIVLVNPGGTFAGSDLVRRNYEHLFADSPSARHLWGDVTDADLEVGRRAILAEAQQGAR
jgi:hypothetical protein